MDVNTELLARIYAVYEYYMSQAELIPLSTGFHRPKLTPDLNKSINDDDFADFLAKLSELSDDDDGEEGGGGGTLKGLRKDEQIKSMQRLIKKQIGRTPP